MFSELFFFMWDTMHILTLCIEPADAPLHPAKKTAIVKLIEGIIALIPCSTCAGHAVEYYYFRNRLNPNTGREAFEWTVTFHNYVNEQNGKRKYTFEEAENALQKRFGINGELKDMLRAEVKHREADAKIKELQAIIKLYEQLLQKNQIVVDEKAVGLVAKQTAFAPSNTTTLSSDNKNLLPPPQYEEKQQQQQQHKIEQSVEQNKHSSKFMQKILVNFRHLLGIEGNDLQTLIIMILICALIFIFLFLLIIMWNLASLRKRVATSVVQYNKASPLKLIN